LIEGYEQSTFFYLDPDAADTFVKYLECGRKTEKLAYELDIKPETHSKSTISMYENDKVDIKGSILVELSRVLHTSLNYLLDQEEYDEGLLDMITII